MEGMEIVEGLPRHPQNDGNAVEDMAGQESAGPIYVRRSVRDPNLSYLERPEVKKLLGRIHADDHDTVILKLKDHLVSDINSLVLDEVITALHSNSCCQALYFQNVSRAMKDTQIDKLIELLLVKPIWCLNLGENYQVSNEGWATFCNALPRTNVTHLYISEHVITLDLKNKIRSHIRDNRKKHDKHSNLNNLDVIERCTNMWWNPINGMSPSYPILSRFLDFYLLTIRSFVLNPIHILNSSLFVHSYLFRSDSTQVCCRCREGNEGTRGTRTRRTATTSKGEGEDGKFVTSSMSFTCPSHVIVVVIIIMHERNLPLFLSSSSYSIHEYYVIVIASTPPADEEKGRRRRTTSKTWSGCATTLRSHPPQ